MSGDFSKSAGQGDVKARQSHAHSWLGDDSGRGWGRRRRMILFSLKREKATSPPESIPKLI